MCTGEVGGEGNKAIRNLNVHIDSMKCNAIPGHSKSEVPNRLIKRAYNHATSNLAIYFHETSQDKLLEA